MASVFWKNSQWYARLKGEKVPGKWGNAPTGESERSDAGKARALAVAERKQSEIDARPKLPPRKRRARIHTPGIIYALRLLPDIAPNRIKVGFTSSKLDLRLAQHRVTCPALEVLAKWRAKRIDEARAHRALDGRIGPNEIFDVADVAAALAALDGLLGERV